MSNCDYRCGSDNGFVWIAIIIIVMILANLEERVLDHTTKPVHVQTDTLRP